MESAFLLLGTNLGDRLQNLESARQKLHALGVISGASRVYETEPWGISEQPSFYNQAVRLETNLSPDSLLKELKNIEAVCGRTEAFRWGPRVMDIDILLFGQLIQRSDSLSIPHPKLSERRFALAPLNEIAPDVSEPISGKMVRDLLKACTDNLEVFPIRQTTPPGA
jgi:2-amino-4-hydroxy-6-hydroxymethyldihydropteridine diphosphokinase